MQSKAKSVSEYLDELPPDRRSAIEAVREVVLKHLPEGCEEGMQYGMIGYFVPHSVYPDGYHCDPSQPLPYAHLASQKNHMALCAMVIYSFPGVESWFRKAWAKTGKKLDMGKSCIRFKKLDDLPLELIGEAIGKVTVPEYVVHYEATVKNRKRGTSKKTRKKKC